MANENSFTHQNETKATEPVSEKLLGSASIVKLMQIISKADSEKLKIVVSLINEELERRERKELDDLLEMFKTLDKETDQ